MREQYQYAAVGHQKAEKDRDPPYQLNLLFQVMLVLARVLVPYFALFDGQVDTFKHLIAPKGFMNIGDLNHKTSTCKLKNTWVKGARNISWVDSDIIWQHNDQDAFQAYLG